MAERGGGRVKRAYIAGAWRGGVFCATSNEKRLIPRAKPNHENVDDQQRNNDPTLKFRHSVDPHSIDSKSVNFYHPWLNATVFTKSSPFDGGHRELRVQREVASAPLTASVGRKPAGGMRPSFPLTAALWPAR